MQKCSLVNNSLDAKSFYGIKIETDSGDIYEYKYISAFYDEADELMRKMTANYISPLHFNDIIADHLTKIYYSRLALNGLLSERL